MGPISGHQLEGFLDAAAKSCMPISSALLGAQKWNQFWNPLQQKSGTREAQQGENFNEIIGRDDRILNLRHLRPEYLQSRHEAC